MATKKKTKSPANKKAIAKVQPTENGFVLQNPDGRYFGISHESKAKELSFEDAERLEMHDNVEHAEVFETEAKAKAVAGKFEQYQLTVVEVEQFADDLDKPCVAVVEED